MITSVQHPLVKHMVKLRTDGAYRHYHQTLMIEGFKLICEHQHRILRLFYTPAAEMPDCLQGEVHVVSKQVMDKISGMTHSEGIAAEVAMPLPSTLEGAHRVLALDGINDPGNLGTLLRTALALGWDGVFLMNHCCDPYNEKVLRAARGAQFVLPIREGTVEELHHLALDHDWECLCAELHGEVFHTLPKQSKRLLVMGNEAHGPSPEVREFCRSITIPMCGAMESLNVGVAGGILLYALNGSNRS